MLRFLKILLLLICFYPLAPASLEASIEFSVTNEEGGEVLDFGMIKPNATPQTKILRVSVKASPATPYHVLQEMRQPLLSEKGVLFDERTIDYKVQMEGAQKAKLNGPTVLYSDSKGESSSFDIQYELTPTLRQRAGVYSGYLRLGLESSSAESEKSFISIPIEVQIEPYLYLEAVSPDGKTLDFGNLDVAEESDKKVKIIVHSNMARPYQVTQTLENSWTMLYNGPLVKEELVPKGESVVFRSDKRGSPAEFELHYKWKADPDTPEGDLRSEIQYVVSTL